MDEREARELLTNAAEAVVPSADLSARAKRRYLRRRTRARGVVVAVVVAIVGSGLATAAVVNRNSETTKAAQGTASTTTTSVTTTTPPPSSAVSVSNIISLSFVNANVGFGTDNEGASDFVVRTDDGGRTWRRLGGSEENPPLVHFENASDGVQWGIGPLKVTIDGGVHWREPTGGGPVDNSLAWADGRLWAITPCVQSTPCGSAPMLISDDVGLTWQRAGVVRQGLGGAIVMATSRSTAYVVEPATDQQQTTGWRIAVTGDGGSTWKYEPTPCGSLTPYLAGNGAMLLLVCAQGPTAAQEFEVYMSDDQGGAWRSMGKNLFGGGYLGGVTNVGSTFVAAMRRGEIWSSPDGKSWSRGTNVQAGFWAIDSLPGVGAWAANEDSPDNPNSGIWFSADGVQWSKRAGGG